MTTDQQPAVPAPTHGPPIPPPTERDLRRDASIEYELITAAMPWKSWTDRATSDLILGWIRLAAHYKAALDAERRRAEGAEAEVRHLREAKNCYYDCVSKHEANQRIAEAQEEALEMVRPMIAAAEAERDALRQEVAGLLAGLERMMPLAERAALVIAHHALNSRECSLVCRRCEAEKVLAQARQLLDRPT